jgi:proline dehydrogenase
MSVLLELIASRVAPRIARRAGRAYVAGSRAEDALRICRRAARRRLAATLSYWNTDTDEPAKVALTCRVAIERLATAGLDACVSLKAPALGWDESLLDEILARARARRIGVRFDSLAPDTVDRTFHYLARATARHPGLGCTIPARWRRSAQDAERALELGLQVRVVKGEWPDPEGPERELAECFAAMVDRLAGRARHVAIATHDARLVGWSIERLRGARTPFEVELLFGLPLGPPLRAVRARGARARLYVPYGQGRLPYALRSVPANPRSALWLFRDLTFGASGMGAATGFFR